MLRRLRHLPNVITSIRILLVVPIALALAHHRPVEALWLLAIAAASDGIDGFLAAAHAGSRRRAVSGGDSRPA